MSPYVTHYQLAWILGAYIGGNKLEDDNGRIMVANLEAGIAAADATAPGRIFLERQLRALQSGDGCGNLEW